MSDSNRSRRRQFLGLVVAASLFITRLQDVRGEEAHADYRYQIYREDNDRISVDTHTALFDMSIGPKVRLNGEYVIDAISGATPSGAPAYKDMALPAIYTQSPVQYGLNVVAGSYGPQMAAQGFDGDPQGYINFVNANQPGFAAQVNSTYSQATNDLAVARATNKYYRSGKVPTTEMHDNRQSISLGMPISFGANTLTPQFSRSEESDYHSVGAALNYARDFNDKNTTLNLGWSHNFDSVHDDVGQWRDKNTDDFFIGVNQLLGPKAYLTANVTYGRTDGYLNDPYRGIYAANATLQDTPTFVDDNGVPITDPAINDGWRLENRPREKDKVIAYLSYVQFIPALKGSVDTAYRFYHDTFGVTGHTFQLAWHQKVGKKIMISPSFRYYRQEAADFYYYMVPDYNSWPQYYSADYRLSELQSFTYGLSLTWRVAKWFSLDVTYSRYVMEGLDGVTAQDAYPAADVLGFGARLWF